MDEGRHCVCLHATRADTARVAGFNDGDGKKERWHLDALFGAAGLVDVINPDAVVAEGARGRGGKARHGDAETT